MTATFFYQECPTCGRALRVRINYLGKAVVCDHCRGTFTAVDPMLRRELPTPNPLSSLERADELLAKLERRDERFQYSGG
ncbi:MAG: hypothetical protein QM811_20540 [Pirellulales bacterium]